MQARIAESDGLTGRAVRFQTDAEGFLLPARRHAAPDLTVAFLGGSTTVCEYVADSLRFHALTVDAIEARTGLRTNALNAARSGNHSLHSLTLFTAKVLPQRPDVVVLMHNVNDLTTLLRVGSYWNDNPSRGLLTHAPCATAGCHLRLGMTKLSHTVLPGISTRLWSLQRRGSPRSEFDTPAGPVDATFAEQQFRSSLVTFVETARAWGVAPLLMTQANRIAPVPDPALSYPHDELGVPYTRFQALYDRFNEVVREVAEAHGVPLVDLAALVPPDREHLYDFVHLTDAGSRVVAEGLTAALLAGPVAAIPGDRQDASAAAERSTP